LNRRKFENYPGWIPYSKTIKIKFLNCIFVIVSLSSKLAIISSNEKKQKDITRENISTQETEYDKYLENNIRPKTFEDFNKKETDSKLFCDDVNV